MAFRAPDGARFKYTGAALLYGIEHVPGCRQHFEEFYPVTFAWFMTNDRWNDRTPTRFEPLLRQVLRAADFIEEQDHA